MRNIDQYKRRFISYLVLTLLPLLALGQTAGTNYTRTLTAIEASTSEPYAYSDLSRITVEYFDGLGRSIQTVRGAASCDYFDLATLTEYDLYGRACRTWLPVELSTSSLD